MLANSQKKQSKSYENLRLRNKNKNVSFNSKVNPDLE